MHVVLVLSVGFVQRSKCVYADAQLLHCTIGVPVPALVSCTGTLQQITHWIKA